MFKNIKLKKKEEKKETYTFREMLMIMLFSIIVGAIGCFSFMKLFYEANNYSVLTGDLSKLVNVYNTIMTKYYKKVDKDELIDEAISGMMSVIDDPYTSYISEEQAESFHQKVEGLYEGIGCQVATTTDGDIIVLEVFDNSPAKEAGLLEGDIILTINDINLDGKNSIDMANYVKNTESSEIKLKIKRLEEEKEIVLKREKVEIPSVYSKIFENNNKKIGYLRITIFSGVTDKQFIKNLEELEKEDIDSLIIDVRDNSGGYLDTVTNILNKLLPKDSIMYKLETNGKTKNVKVTDKEKRSYPIAVLTNKSTASASEILASAIKENYGGYIVGDRTFGKATVQQTKTLTDGSMLKYTTQKWLTPNGNWINEIGLEPTNEVSLDESYYENPVYENDNQLDTAIKILSE